VAPDEHMILPQISNSVYTGCMAALDAEHYLQEVGAQEGKSD
jgi:thioredoxin reductase